jgi:hypothetical protein
MVALSVRLFFWKLRQAEQSNVCMRKAAFSLKTKGRSCESEIRAVAL